MTWTTFPGSHPDDGYLMRALDHEELEEDVTASCHVAECPECLDRLDGLRRADQAWKDLLAAADGLGAPGPQIGTRAARSSRHRALVAAVVALLLAMAFVPRARAAVAAGVSWVGERIQSVLGVGVEAPALRGHPDPFDAVEIDVGDGWLAVDVVQAAKDATLQIAASGQTRAVLRIEGVEPALVTLLPDTLRLRIPEGASYRLELPRTAAGIVVRVGGVVTLRSSTEALAERGPVDVPLTPSDGSS